MLNIDTFLAPGDHCFYRLENADKKVWILPVKHLSTALELYQPSGIKGRTLKRLLPCLHSLGFVRKLARVQQISGELSEEIVHHACKAFGVGDIEYSIFGGTPSVHQKITIQFYSGRHIYGYGKVTVNSEIAGLFCHEDALLGKLHSAGIDNIPECLYCGELSNGLYLFIQSTVKTAKSFSPSRWTPLHERFLLTLHDRTKTELAFEKSDFAVSIMALKEHITYLPEKFRPTVESKIDAIINRKSGSTVEYSAFHADFTPWNMFVDESRLFVFDWEYGRMSYPPMLDRYHFYVQQALHVSHLTPGDTLLQLKKFKWFSHTDLLYYLLDTIARFTLREKGHNSENLNSNLEFWMQMIE